MSEDTRNALNALLYHTGSASHRLMMVLATNRAEVRMPTFVFRVVSISGVTRACTPFYQALRSSVG